MIDAAIGLRPHTGWATLVVIGRAPSALIDRRRLELLAPGVPDQLYHTAAERESDDAAGLVAETLAAIDAFAARALRKVLDEQRARSRNVIACGLIGTTRTTPALAAGPPSHARLQAHVAEIGHTAGAPWRADQKLAAMAAMLALARAASR